MPGAVCGQDKRFTTEHAENAEVDECSDLIRTRTGLCDLCGESLMTHASTTTRHAIEEMPTLFGVERRKVRARERGIVGAGVDQAPGSADATRLITQKAAVLEVLRSAAGRGEWLTVEDIEMDVWRRFRIRCPQASASAQVRNLRKVEGGGHEIDWRYREGAKVAEYRMVT